MTVVDQQLDAIGALIQSRLNHDADPADPLALCRKVVMGPLAGPVPFNHHPFLELLRPSEKWRIKGTGAAANRVVPAVARYYLGPRPRTALGDAFPTLTARAGAILEVLLAQKYADWNDGGGPDGTDPVVHYNLAQHGGISRLQPLGCEYAYSEGGAESAQINPALIVNMEFEAHMTAYLTDREPLTRIDVNLNLEVEAGGAGGGTLPSGWHFGRLQAVCT